MASSGDEVLYVPGEEYAFNKGPDGFAWSFGRKIRGSEDEVEELSEQEVHKMMQLVKRIPSKRNHLVAIQPKKSWSAVVVSVSPGGRASLDVDNEMGGVTLHLNNIPHDPSGEEPNSWHEESEN